MSTSKLKISIAALSLCVPAVAIYIHLPYVIAAVSGSGAIVAVPLAIFAVSTIVALASVAYLIKLVVSRASNKKEADPDGEQKTKSKQLTTEEPVRENSANLESGPIGEEPVEQDRGSQAEVDSGASSQDKSSVSTSPSQPPQTHVTAVPQVPHSATPPPPPPFGAPPPPPLNFFTASKRTEQPKNGVPKKAGEPGNDNDRSALLKQIREGIKLKATNDDTTQKNTTTEKSTPPGGGGQGRKELMAELFTNLKSRREAISGKQKGDVQRSNNLTGAFSKMLDRIPPPRSRSDSVSSNSSEESEQDWSDEDTHQLDNKKGTSTPESGYRSDDDQQYPETAAPPSHQPNTKKPPIPPKPVNSKTKPEAPPASQVNEVRDPSALSLKDRMALFDQKAYRGQFQACMQKPKQAILK